MYFVQQAGDTNYTIKFQTYNPPRWNIIWKLSRTQTTQRGAWNICQILGINQQRDLNPIEIQNWNCFDKYLWLECGHLFASPSGNSWATVHAFDVCRANAPNFANLDNPCQPSPEYFDFNFLSYNHTSRQGRWMKIETLVLLPNLR